MAKLEWDKLGERYYETGVKNVVLFPFSAGSYQKGVAWSGVTGITESPSGAESQPFYADNIKYLNLMSNEEFGATIEAYTYPDEFAACDGSAEVAKGIRIGQQKRSQFGFSYVTQLGNDEEQDTYGYQIHLVYGALAAPSERTRTTIGETPEPLKMSWTVTTTPVKVPGFKPTAHIVVNSTEVDAEELKALEDKLYGTVEAESKLPTPEELIALFPKGSIAG